MAELESAPIDVDASLEEMMERLPPPRPEYNGSINPFEYQMAIRFARAMLGECSTIVTSWVMRLGDTQFVEELRRALTLRGDPRLAGRPEEAEEGGPPRREHK